MKPIIRLLVSSVFSICLVLCFNSNSIANVGPDGSFNYSIPIELPQGTAGCAPSLALVYNSDAGNGMLGQGWDLAGLGTITRDTTYPINYNGTDHFIGPGGRLVDTGTYDPQGNKVYHYENESFCRVSLVGTIGESSSYWLETKPDGTKYYYGFTGDGCETSNSKIDAIGKGTQLRAWALSKVEDLHGNFYSIIYLPKDPTTGEYYPSLITYTKNLGFNLTDRTVQFSYKSKSDYGTSYMFGCPVQTTKLLKTIDISPWDSSARRYALEYDNLGAVGRSRLVSVADSGSEDGVWEFGWGNDNINFSPTNIISQIPEAYFTHRIVHIGDFNGDGKSDIYCQPKGIGNGTELYLATDNGNFTPVPNFSNQIPDAYSTYMIAHIGDFNGDGKSDIYFQPVQSGCNTMLYLATGNGNFTPINIASQIIDAFSTHRVVHIGDFNGDGKSDIYCQPRGIGNGTELYLATGNGNFTPVPNFSAQISGAYSTYMIAHIGDFNGDGKSDIYFQPISSGNGTALYLATSNGNFEYVDITSKFSDKYTTHRQVHIGDFNGDSKSDIYFQPVSSGNGTELYLATGNGNFEYVNITSNLGDKYTTYRVAHIGDFNGDGMNDIYFQPKELGNGTELYSTNQQRNSKMISVARKLDWC